MRSRAQAGPRICMILSVDAQSVEIGVRRDYPEVLCEIQERPAPKTEA